MPKIRQATSCSNGRKDVIWKRRSSFITWLMGQSAPAAKLEGVSDEPESYAAVQTDFDRLGNGPANLIKFSEERCQALHLRKNDPMHQ